MLPYDIIPPIPSFLHFVFSSKFIKSSSFVFSVNAIDIAIIAGSSACILTFLGLDAKLAPALINSS